MTRPQLVSDQLFLPLPVRLTYGLEIGRWGESAEAERFISSAILEENLRLVFYQIFPFWSMHGQRTPHLCFTINASSGLCYAMGHQRSSLGAIPEAPTPGPRAYKMVKQHKTRPCSAILACLEPRWSCLLAVPHSLLHNNTPSEPASHDSRDTTVIESCRVA